MRPFLKEGVMNNKKVRYLLAAFIVLVFSSSALAAIPVNVVVGKGTVVTLKEPSKRVSLSNPDIADVSLISPTEIIVNGKKTGYTNLIIWDKQGKATFFDIKVSVSCGDTAALEAYIKELSPDSNVTTECEGDLLILRGTIKNRYTCKRDKEPIVTHRDEKTLVDLIETRETDTCVETYTNIEQIARHYSGKVLNLVKVPDAEQIILEIKVAQIDKSKLKELGISWFAKGNDAEGFSNLVGAPGGSTTIGDTTFSTSGTGIAGTIPGLGSFDPLDTYQLGVSYFSAGIGAVIKALAEKGYGKILAEPNLVVRSGEGGKFLVGTKVPIQTVTGTGGDQTVGITYEEVGIKLNFKPQVLETGVIRLKIDPAEVSNVVQFLTFQGIIAPEIDTRTITTSVDLREGESLIMAGLLSEEMVKNIQKIPLLGDIPILGALFRTSRDELKQKELAFFITPKMVKPIPPGVRPALPTDKKLTPEEEKEFEWVPMPQKSEEGSSGESK
jgi:pilus assembly protein CpaC